MRIHRDGVALGYEEAGRGDPPIILVHGWGTDRSVLQPLSDDLRRSHRVLALDLRGFGESDAPEQSYTIEIYTDDLAFIADQLGLESPIVIGHSMGGIIALDFAARHGDRISAAVVLEGMIVAPELLAGLHVLVSALEGILAFDSVTAAAHVQCPLLYVGTNAAYTNVARLRDLCPQVLIGQLVGCGHYFPLEVPGQLSPMVARFIETLGQRGDARSRALPARGERRSARVERATPRRRGR